MLRSKKLIKKDTIKMGQDEKRIYLINKLLEENPRYLGIKVPQTEDEQKKLLRSLMNIRSPKPVSDDFIKIQDEYLREEVEKRGIVDSDTLIPCSSDKRLVIWKGDITSLKVDAIVNAANSALRGCFIPCHSCIDNIIHSLSGIQLRLTCDDIIKRQGYDEPVGSAKITPAFNLPAKFVIHTVGPIVCGQLTDKNIKQLESCYRSCLEIAEENGLKSIAFCCISTGEFHFPNREAAETAVRSVKEFLEGNKKIRRVIFNVFKEKDLEIYEKLLKK